MLLLDVLKFNKAGDLSAKTLRSFYFCSPEPKVYTPSELNFAVKSGLVSVTQPFLHSIKRVDESFYSGDRVAEYSYLRELMGLAN